MAPRGDVRSSWSRGLPPAADVRMVNNRERSVEGGIPRCSLRSPSSRPSPGPRPPGSLGWWGCGRARGERRFGRRPRRLEWLAPRRLPWLDVLRSHGAREAPDTSLRPARLRDHMLGGTQPCAGGAPAELAQDFIAPSLKASPLDMGRAWDLSEPLKLGQGNRRSFTR